MFSKKTILFTIMLTLVALNKKVDCEETTAAAADTTAGTGGTGGTGGSANTDTAGTAAGGSQPPGATGSGLEESDNDTNKTVMMDANPEMDPSDMETIVPGITMEETSELGAQASKVGPPVEMSLGAWMFFLVALMLF